MSDPSNMFSKLEQQRQESASDVKPKESSESKDSPTKRRKGKSADPDYTQIGCYIRKDLYRQVKGKAGLEGVEISDVIGELLSQWVEG